MVKKFQTLKGFYDVLPEKQRLWRFFEQEALNILDQYHYQEIGLPLVEPTRLFVESVGNNTDIVEKEMYSWEDNLNKDKLTLRPEGTAGCVRAIIENNLTYNGPVKLFYRGPMFRHENVQKGRQRQFHQFGVEAIGSANPEQDAEVIALGWEILKKAGINNLELKLSSIGSKECRNKYKNALVNFLKPHVSKLSETSKRRLENNPLRILDTKNKNEIQIIKSAPKIENYYTKEDQDHFDQVKIFLKSMNIPFTIDPLLVRGLDYYTQTTFEIISNDLGAQDALIGGGRYDGLIESLGGKDTAAIGFAAGMERILMAIDDTAINKKTTPTIYIVCVDKEALGPLQKLSIDLRKIGYKVLFETLRRSMRAQMRDANKYNANFAIIVGQQELVNKTIQLKNLSNGNQETIELQNVFNYFKSLTF